MSEVSLTLQKQSQYFFPTRNLSLSRTQNFGNFVSTFWWREELLTVKSNRDSKGDDLLSLCEEMYQSLEDQYSLVRQYSPLTYICCYKIKMPCSRAVKEAKVGVHVNSGIPD